MGRVLGKMKRTISVLLAAAMIVTALPQTSAPVYASEAQDMSDEGGGADGVKDTAEQNAAERNDSDEAASAEQSQQDENDSGDQEDSKDEEVIEEPETGVDTEAGQPDADEKQNGDETEAEEQESDEETETDADESLTDDVEELDEATVQAYKTDEESGDDQEVKKINVNINLPYYRESSYVPYLAEFSYATGADDEFTSVDMEKKANYQGKYTVSIPVEVDTNFRFKLTCKDNTRLKDVTLSSQYGYNDYSNPTSLEAKDDVYTIEVKEQDDYGWMNVQSYEVDISAVQIWTVTFVDLYARNHDGTASVEVYQNKESDNGETELVDITNKTITVDSDEWGKYSCYYKVKTKENFTFGGMAAAVSGITINDAGILSETNAYRLEKNSNAPKDITIFVTAEETQNKKITLNMPSEVTNAMQVAVYGKEPSQPYKKLELTDGTVMVRDDMTVYVEVTSNNMAYMVQATYQETGEEPEPFAESDVNTTVEDGSWTREYTLGTLNHVNDEITINLSRAKMNQVRIAVNWEAVSEIRVSTPVSGYYSGYYYEDEDESEAITVYVPEKEVLKFYVEMKTGKGAACVSGEDGKEIGSADYDNGWRYSITPASDMTLSVKGREYEYRFDYSEDDFDILVYESKNRNDGPTGDPLDMTDHCCHTYEKNSYLWVLVRPKTDKEFSVWYNRGSDSEEVERAEWSDRTEEDGKYFCYGSIDEYWAADNTITIEGYNANTVTFETEDDLSFMKMIYYSDYDVEEDYRINDPVTVREGEDLYFGVDGYNKGTHRLRISMTGTDPGSLESFVDVINDYGYIYHLVPTADTTIKVALEERKKCEVEIEKSDNVKSFYAYYIDMNGDDDDTSTAGTYTTREDGYIRISEIVATGSETEAAAKKGKVIYWIGEEPYEVLPEYDFYGASYYRIKVTDSMKISIDVQDITQHTLSFKDFDQLENIRVWKLGTYKEKDNLYKANDGTVTLNDDGYYFFDFQLKDGVGLDSVVLKDDTGNEKILARADMESADGELGYQIGMLRGNMEIVPELVSGYTVKFDLSKLSAEEAAAVAIYASCGYAQELIVGQQDNQNIGSRKISAVATESCSFYLSNWKQYKLTPDSELFTLTKVEDYENYEDYVCVISPKQATGLSEVVTISLEKYAEHTVTLDYSDEIRSISLSGIYGNSFKPVENQTKVYKVYGEGAVLKVKAIDGYSPVVKIKGTEEGAETTELTPYRLDSKGASEYYLDELEEDKIIQITVARSTQRKTYKVGFLSEGGQVTVMDSVYDTVYGVYDNQEDYSADYSVFKGDKISFWVQPYLGYELKGVYANGQEVQPVRDVAQRDIYEVTPVADTQIRIDVSKIVPMYPLTFSWSNADAVKAVKVSGYELQNNRIDVEAGTKISFSVELTDTKYSVTSVTMNELEVPYSAGDECYTLTALEEPMNVEINASVADKVVRFSNTLENAQYEVETNELIRFRNDNTYLVSGNAELLKFKVNVSDKTQKVGVTYINQKGVKSVLKEKGQTDQGEQGLSYSYEIAVSELPLNSEITISGEIPAGDKTELEKAVTKYDGYKKSDYTEESWTAFEKALMDAKDCMKNEDATQEEIDVALGKLTKAASELVKKSEQPTPEYHEGLWFEILENDETADGSYIYTGAAIKPEIKVYFGDKLLEVKKDYVVAYKSNTNAGTATVTVTGKGNFKGNDKATFEIKKKDIAAEDISVADVYAIINNKGKVTNPKLTVKFGKKTLKLNNDYAVTYPDLETEKDEAGNDKIVAKDYEITISTTAVKKDKKGNPVDSVNYTGTRKIKYTVRENNTQLMSKAKVTLEKTKVDYKNNEQGEHGKGTEQPAVTVKMGNDTLTKDVDYVVSYENWDKIGKATVTVTAKDNTKYYGSKSVTYTVNGTKLAAKDLTIVGINATYDYTGEPIYVSANGSDKGSLKVNRTKGVETPVELKEGEDYEVSYKTGKKLGEHINVGTVTVTITGINAYTGSVSKTFKITAVDLATFVGENVPDGCKFKAEDEAKYTKTGAKPEITELSFNGTNLVEKQDYTLTYQKNNKVEAVAGNKSATMIIKGKGNFKGQIKHPYAVTIASADDVYATAVDIVKPAKFNQLKSTVKVFEKETGKALKAGTDYDKNITYYSDAACTNPITAETFETDVDIDKEIYAKVIMKDAGSYAGATETATPGYVTAKFRVYDSTLKMANKKIVVTVDTTVDKDGKDILCDTSKAKNPYYTGTAIEPKVTVTLKGTGGAEDKVLEEKKDYEVAYTNNTNKGKATITVTGIGNGYGGSKSVKFTIVPKDMTWAEQAVKKAAEFLSNLMFAPN